MFYRTVCEILCTCLKPDIVDNMAVFSPKYAGCYTNLITVNNFVH